MPAAERLWRCPKCGREAKQLVGVVAMGCKNPECVRTGGVWMKEVKS